jgi:hypothetical protein
MKINDYKRQESNDSAVFQLTNNSFIGLGIE